MTHVSVELDQLEVLGRTLGGLHERLAHVITMVSSLGDAVTGHHGLAAALDDFGEEWRFSLGKIKEHAEGLGDMVVQAADAYRHVDAEIARAARG